MHAPPHRCTATPQCTTCTTRDLEHEPHVPSVYNLYDTCNGDTAAAAASAATSSPPPAHLRTMAEWNALLSADVVRVEGPAPPRHPQLHVGGALNDYPCGGDRAAAAWLERDDVTAALHVRKGAGMSYRKGPMSFSGDNIYINITIF